MSDAEIQLLLSRRPTITPEAFSFVLSRAEERLRLRLAKERIELALLLPDLAVVAPVHSAASAAGRRQWDAILTVRGDIADGIAALGSIDDLLHEVIDREQSACFAGYRHTILEATGSIRLTYALGRLANLTLAQFQDHWLNVHADIGRRLLPPYSYHQIHARVDWALRTSESLGLRSSGFDGIVECHFPDVQAFKVQLSRPDVSDEALADERNFIDHARSIPALYRMDVHPQ